MTFRYIIRPSDIRGTPQRLCNLFGAQQTLRYRQRFRSLRPSYHHDFFLAYPSIEELLDYDHQNNCWYENPRDQLTRGYNSRSIEQYQNIRNFFTSNKRDQRFLLRGLSFPIPNTFSSLQSLGNTHPFTNPQCTPNRFIVRPLRHREGQGYLLTTNPFESTFNPSTEYIQELYPKDHEYRVIIVRGTPLITLLKRVPPSLSQDQPWNHANGSSFVTVTDPQNNRLRHTDLFSRIQENSDFFSGIDLCALDVMVNLQHTVPYVLAELNFCPSITIESNLERIKQHVDQILPR